MNHNDAVEAAETFSGPELEQLVRAGVALSRAVQMFSSHAARSCGLTPQQFFVLLLTTDAEGITTRSLGRALGLSTSTVTGLVDRLEDRGLVNRHPAPDDRRLHLLRATSSGIALREQTVGLVLKDLESALGELDPAGLVAVERFLVGAESAIRGRVEARPEVRGPRNVSRRTLDAA